MSVGSPHAPAGRGTSGTDPRASIEVLVVDDERSLRESCASLLQGMGFPTTVCGRGDDARRMIRNRAFDIVLVDQSMSHVDGIELLGEAIGAHEDTVAIVMTESPSVESSITALQAGAWDYLPKPFSATHFEVLIGRAAHTVLEQREKRQEQGTALKADVGYSEHVALFGESASLRKVIDLASRVAPTDASVFITGESGTGKEVIAQYIHAHSRRAGADLVPVNCAAIPEALLESEMFGHVEGAFTGAVRDKKGLLEAAHGGTLFLDELTEMPLPTQAKLLRVLQDGVVRRVGSVKTDAIVDIRVIAATNRDPMRAIADGTLRKDLYYRLRVVPIDIDPLRQRREDVPLLAGEFLKEFWSRHRDPSTELPTFSAEAVDALMSAEWRGNVRELRNVIEHVVVLADPGAVIGVTDIVFLDDDPADPAHAGGIAPIADLGSMDYHTARGEVLSHFEVEYLSALVKASNGNISDAARTAGVDRTTLYRLMDKHGIQRDG